MPIPFRAADEADALGEAGFLKIDPSPVGPGFLGALFLVNARGEPVEFTYSRVETPFAALWRPDDVRRVATRQLVVAVLSLCPRAPHLILSLAGEIERELFERVVRLSVPVGQVASAVGAASPTFTGAPADLFWLSDGPAEDSDASRLLAELTARQLLLEPFERASRGLREVYGAGATASR